jgi:hypothetical protein
MFHCCCWGWQVAANQPFCVQPSAVFLVKSTLGSCLYQGQYDDDDDNDDDDDDDDDNGHDDDYDGDNNDDEDNDEDEDHIVVT